MKQTRPLAIVLLGLLALANPACSFLGLGSRQKDVRHLGRGRLVVLPFATPKKSYFESQIGARFAQEIAATIREELPEADVVDPYDLSDDLVEAANRGMTLLAMGKRLKADFVLIGEIYQLTYKEPKSIKILKGTMRLSARVARIDDGKIVWRTRPRICTFHYPRLMGGTEMIPADGVDEETVARKVMTKAAIAVASPFIGRRAVQRQLEKNSLK